MGGYWLFRWITWFLVVILASLLIGIKWPMNTEPTAYWIIFGIFTILWATALAGLDTFAQKVHDRRGGE